MEELLAGRDVILYGGSPKARGPELKKPIIARVNNHHLWQEDNERCPDGYTHTDIVYFGASLSGLIAMFMNRPPQKLQVLCQDLGTTPRNNMGVWAKAKKVKYKPYLSHSSHLDLNAVVERPFSGVFAAWDLLKYPIKSLHITGMDFYRETDTIKKGYRGEHEIEGNIKAIQRIIEDDRTCPDGLLRECIR